MAALSYGGPSPVKTALNYSIIIIIVVVLYNYGISYVTNFTGEAKNSLETSV